MSVSQPSRVIYAADVPEAKDLVATFQYNFFTTDESVTETGGVPTTFLSRQADAVDAAFVQYATTRAPRFVTINFKHPRLKDPGDQNDDLAQRNHVFTTGAQKGSLIADNIDKVVSEDHLVAHGFVAASFHDGEIDDKVHYMVSGSYVMHGITEHHDHHVSHYKAAHRLHALGPKHIKPHYLFRALANPARAHGTRLFDKRGQRVFDQYFQRMKEVMANAQVNGKLFHDITNRTIKDPHSPFTTDMHSMHKFTKKVKSKATIKSSLQLSESDFATFIPFIDVKVRKTAHHHNHRGPEIVGYIVDKTEFTRDGQIRHHTPLVIDNPRVHFTADFRVKYHAQYAYDVRTVALFTIPAIDDDTGDIAMCKVLVSSKPSNRAYVLTEEHVAPPPASDLNFTWDYARVNPATADHDADTGEPLPGTGIAGSLLIHWTFPPNSQRDIKKFQVFRRRDTNHPFELIKMFNFDDSLVRFPDNEDPDPSLVEYLTSPCTFFYDDDFRVDDIYFPDQAQNDIGQKTGDFHPGSSTYTYAIAAIDAHGQSSHYSAQFEVWFDQFKNQLQKRLVSHAGAPKPYPNLYLEADAFVDTIRVAGPYSKQVKLYFNPEFYALYDDNNRIHRVLATEQTGGSYRLQFINTDNQKSAAVTISVNDQTRLANRTIAFPQVRFGARKRSQPQRVTTR